MTILECEYDGPPHEFPDDWEFGGADGKHPGADPRFLPTTYTYYNRLARPIFSTQTPQCDDQAIDEFTRIANFGPSFSPVWVIASRPPQDGIRAMEMLPWTYDKTTDTATERHE